MRENVIKAIKYKAKAISTADLCKKLETKFFRMHSAIEHIHTALKTGKNIILYGPGGFGKSQLVKAVLRELDISSSTIVGYQDMEPEALIGIPNMDKLMKHSVYETAFERTAFRIPGVMILEEFLDCRPSTASVLKDIMTEGGLRRGNTFVESLIGSMIICTNKNPDDVALNDSDKAFYKERFPIAVEVVWDDFGVESYRAFLHHKETGLPDSHVNVLAEVCARTVATSNTPISPRIVIDSVDILKDSDNDLYSLRFINLLHTDTLTDIIHQSNKMSAKQTLDVIFKKTMEHVDSIAVDKNTTMRVVTSAISSLKYIEKQLINLTKDYPNNIDAIANQVDIVRRKRRTVTKVLESTTTVGDIVKLEKLFES